MKAIAATARQNVDVLKALKLHIGIGLKGKEREDTRLDIQIRIAEIDAEFQAMLNAISADNAEQFDEQKAAELMKEKENLQNQLAQIAATQQAREIRQARLDEIYEILDRFQDHPLAFDDCLLRQILEGVIIESKEKIRVVFKGGLEVEQELG